MSAPSRGASEQHLETRSSTAADATAGGIFLLVSGMVFLTTILLTSVVSRAIVRHPTWKNFCVTWIMFAISYLILVPFGYQSGPQPPFGLCFIQISIIYAVPVLTACSTCALVLQLWFAVQYAIGDPNPHWSQRRSCILLVVPYIVFVIFMIGPAVYGLRHRDTVRRSETGIYCVIKGGTTGRTSAAFVAVLTAFQIGMEGLIMRRLYRKWHSLREINKNLGRGLTASILRVAAFTVLAAFALGLSLLYVTDIPDAIPDLILACVPLMAAILLGAQKDIISVWFFRGNAIAAAGGKLAPNIEIGSMSTTMQTRP